MRYHNVLLPALASLAFAQDETLSVADNPAPTPDALPIEDLRDIPVPTFTVLVDAASQDIPYAPSSAIAAVSSQFAATPLSVFPAATDVPINDAGSADETDDSEATDNVITGSSSISRRDARQMLKRNACGKQPVIEVPYTIDVSSYAAFKADKEIAEIATNANPSPNGYFQNFKNLQASNNAMNYLGFEQIKSYDVDYCAAKCTKKAGCLSFNIFFERDPTVIPGETCENPPAFANIKCAFWGTGLDASTAKNTGQWRSKFQVGIAGSNAYTSYKLGGPVSGWTGPQDLGNAAQNAPLWDCTDTWSYLGYKLLQTGSVDPRLCAAACDAQTAYNQKHPASDSKVVSCNAFGSYIITKSNSTGSYQHGQMCTFYTAYWDKKYATNTAGFDNAIGASYSFSYSTFYGKQGVQPSCEADDVSPSGTYIKGGQKPVVV
ncbi:hypothetical protein Q7P37_010263 [Cladosporium fusiforme]